MRRLKLSLVALAVAAFTLHARAQNLVTWQASQVSGIVNATTTRNIAQLGQGFNSASVFLNITNGGAATGTLQIFIQDSEDGGVTWNDIIASTPFTFGAAAATQQFNIYGQNEGPGLIRSIAGTQPSAGAEISETVPTGTRWELLAFREQLVTSATVANRTVSLTLDDGANSFFEGAATVVQAASFTFVYSHFPGAASGFSSTNNQVYAQLPVGVRLSGGYRIKTKTVNIQVADQYSAIDYVVREWRGLDGTAAIQESLPAGSVRSGPWGDRVRIREKVSGVGGSPTGPTYTVTAVVR